MKKIVTSILAICSLVATVPAGAQPAAGEGVYLEITTDDDEEAAAQLGRSLSQYSPFNVRREGSLIAVKKDGFTLVLEPKVTSDGLDRLVITNLLFARDEPGIVDRMEAVARDLNRQIAGVKFAAEQDGDLRCQTLITFVDRLSLEELEKAFDFMRDLQFVMVIAAPKIMELLRR